MTPYEQGFITKCAEYGVDPVALLKFAATVSWGNPAPAAASVNTGNTGKPGVAAAAPPKPAPRPTPEQIAYANARASGYNGGRPVYNPDGTPAARTTTPAKTTVMAPVNSSAKSAPRPTPEQIAYANARASGYNGGKPVYNPDGTPVAKPKVAQPPPKTTMTSPPPPPAHPADVGPLPSAASTRWDRTGETIEQWRDRFYAEAKAERDAWHQKSMERLMRNKAEEDQWRARHPVGGPPGSTQRAVVQQPAAAPAAQNNTATAPASGNSMPDYERRGYHAYGHAPEGSWHRMGPGPNPGLARRNSTHVDPRLLSQV